ncbi:MAG TPA: class I adenylate-forming enzyme family protein [Candidatus Udaeobacter sp.]|jgi:acyl-CoA synthetase (AMP-forming)/AMP-acid ligase II
MKSDDPLLAAWQKTLSRKGDCAAVLDSTGRIARSFRDIEESARAFEAKIDTLAAGAVVAVQIGNHEDWPAVFIACLRRELVALPLDQSISEQQRQAALEICRASAVVSASPVGASADGTSPDVIRLRTPKDREQAGDVTADWGQNAPSLLKLTSGTTAAPRSIRFRSHQLLADCNQICDTMGISDGDLNFGVIPISHSYGFSNLLTPLIARGVAMVVSRDRTPRAVLTDLARTGATVFPGTPVFYQAFCEMNDVSMLHKVRLFISAGAQLSRSVAKKFFEKFHQRIHSFYGASECGGICYDRDGTTFEDGLVGQSMQGVEIEFVEPTAAVSQIRVRSGAVSDSYFPEPDKLKLGNGAFVPDDLLARHNSALKIVGRISDVINVAGKKVNPAEVEAYLTRFEGVRQAIVFGCPKDAGLRNEEVAACVLASPQVSKNDLLRFCRTGLSPWQVPKRIFILDAFPANERGKISRRELAQRFSARGESSPLRRLAS